MDKREIAVVQKYLRDTLGNQKILLDPETATVDSVEVFLGDEFIAVVSRDTEAPSVSEWFRRSPGRGR